MKARTVIAGVIGAAALAALCAVPAAAQGAPDPAADSKQVPQVQAANGAVVPMPEIAGLDCRAMAAELNRIDESHYRGAELVPRGDPDRLIFEYEDALASQFYDTCLARRSALEDPQPVFSYGFRTR